MSSDQSLLTFWPSADTGIKYIVKCYLEMHCCLHFLGEENQAVYKMKTLQCHMRMLQQPTISYLYP